MAPITRSAADIVDGPGGLGDKPAEMLHRRLADVCAALPELLLVEYPFDDPLGLGGLERRRPGRSDPGPDPPFDRIEVDRKGAHRDHHRVACANFAELLPTFCHWHDESPDELIRPHRVLFRANEKRVDRPPSGPRRRRKFHPGAGSEQRRMRVAGGGKKNQVSPPKGPVSDPRGARGPGFHRPPPQRGPPTL